MSRVHDTAARSGYRPRILLRWYEDDRQFREYEAGGTWYCDMFESRRQALRAARELAWRWVHRDETDRAHGWGPNQDTPPTCADIVDLDTGERRAFDFVASIARQRKAARGDARAELERARQRERDEAAKALEIAKSRAARAGVQE